jgi:hypothetical protein
LGFATVTILVFVLSGSDAGALEIHTYTNGGHSVMQLTLVNGALLGALCGGFWGSVIWILASVLSWRTHRMRRLNGEARAAA